MKKSITVFFVFTIAISIIFTSVTAYADPILPNRLMSLGSSGTDVKNLQESLKQLGYSIEINGIYGLTTKQAVMDFQGRYSGLQKDGVYGPNTRLYMLKALTENQGSEDSQLPSEENVNDNLNEDNALTTDAGMGIMIYTLSQNFIDSNRDKLLSSDAAYPIVKEFNTKLPENLVKNIQYNQYPVAYDYLVVMTSTLNIREQPTIEAKTIKKVQYLDKVNLVQEVKGQFLPHYSSDGWYRIFWNENGEIRFGYVFSKLCDLRSFRFNDMLTKINYLQKTVNESKIGYIYNYKNIKGIPALHDGMDKDSFGNSRDQSAPGYVDLDKSDFRYFPDGMVVSILEDINGYYKVATPAFDGEFYIPKQYISFRNVPGQLKKTIVIDESNQNEGAFEWANDHWELISFTYATTGVEKKYKFETPKGYFMAIEKKPSFLYLKDGTQEIAGFAPYAIRFSGGGYIHGVPVDYKSGQNRYTTDPNNPVNYKEYLFTIGTTPRSHKCVRNFTSHAKFLYDWTDIGSTMVIVMN